MIDPISDSSLNRVDRYLTAILLILAAMRILFAAFSGLDLIGDESYYWDWSRQLDWCYYSKPPMVAWLIALSTAIFGDWVWAVRLPAALLGTVFLWFFHATAKAFYGRQAAALALLMVLATPINVSANFLMTIDAPLYCFWMISLYLMRRALFDGEIRAWWWAGCASGAALLSKQAAILLPILLALFLALDRDRRRLLRRQFLLYLLPIAVAALPILIWNWQHDWVMFGHSKQHFGAHQSPGFYKQLGNAADFLLYQLLLISPLLWLLLVADAAGGLRRFKQLSDQQRFLWLMGPLPLVVVMLLSLLQKAQGNWPMAFYFSAMILLAGKVAADNQRHWLRRALWLGWLLVLMAYGLPTLMQLSGLQNSALDPTKRFKHWQDLAVEIDFERQMAFDGRQPGFVVALGHRYLASELAFYLPDHPKVYRYETSGRIQSQYEVWDGPLQFIGADALVVAPGSRDKLPPALQSAFENFRFLAEVANPDLSGGKYSVFLGEKLKFWPDPINRHVKQLPDVASEN